MFSWMGQPDLREDSYRRNLNTKIAEKIKEQWMNSKLWETECVTEKGTVPDNCNSSPLGEGWAQLKSTPAWGRSKQIAEEVKVANSFPQKYMHNIFGFSSFIYRKTLFIYAI